MKQVTGLGRNIRVHRMSYAIKYGKVPEGKLVCHHCDNPPCVNPNHLFLGDNGANIRDAINKGRFDNRHGENNGRDILTQKQVLEIVDKLKNEESVPSIAKDYPVSKGTITNIKTGKNWAHITGIDKPIGVKNKKVTDRQVKEICERYIINEENITQPELAREYEISISQIRRILYGRRRKDIDRPTL